jgi:hypothetical protein
MTIPGMRVDNHHAEMSLFDRISALKRRGSISVSIIDSMRDSVPDCVG